MDKKIDFENQETFREFERKAYKGILDYKDFQPVDYWYFAKLSELCKKYQLGILSADETNMKRKVLFEKYRAEKEQHKAEEKRCKEWQENIVKSELLKSDICKATSLEEKYILAVQCIEALTLDKVFARHEQETAL